MTRDLTAVAILCEKAGKINALVHFWLPEAEIENAIVRDSLPYRRFIERGWLSLSAGSIVDTNDAVKWIEQAIREYDLYPLKCGYDQYMAAPPVKALEADGLHMYRVFQGEHLTSVIPEAEGLLLDHKINIGDNDLMAVHMLDVAKKVNSENDRCKLTKMNRKSHIDGVAALIDALAVRQFFADEIGEQLHNAG